MRWCTGAGIFCLALCLAAVGHATDPPCGDLAYENRNQTDHGPLHVSGIRGIAQDARGGPIPKACVGVFSSVGGGEKQRHFRRCRAAPAAPHWQTIGGDAVGTLQKALKGARLFVAASSPQEPGAVPVNERDAIFPNHGYRFSDGSRHGIRHICIEAF